MVRFLTAAGAAAAWLFAPSPALAQPVPASADALILKPLVLTKIDDLNFGSVLVTGSGDWVKINADTGARTFSNAAMDIPSAPGKRARFASSGINNTYVVLELSGPPELTNGNGDTVQMLSMVLDQNNKVLRTLTPTSQVFFVGIGGTLYLAPNQAEGVYTGTYSLTATYL